MIIKTIKTRILLPPKDNLFEILEESLPKRIKEDTIVTITSKILSIGEGRCIPINKIEDKDKLIMKECDKYLPRDVVKNGWVMHTLSHNLMIPTAGIDESNALDHYILWPKNPKSSAKGIHYWLKKKYELRNVGVIITDSHSISLRRGTVGISLAHYGFKPINDYRHTDDLFGRELKITQSNIADGLAAAAVVCQGEGSECTPITLISNVPFIKFTTSWKPKRAFSSYEVPPSEDLYFTLLKKLPWKNGRGNNLK
jgi:F420-0:gamma-glutamyl ligase